VSTLLFVTFFVNFVEFTGVHPVGVCNASLHVNVNCNAPLVHADSVIVHVGFAVSISLNVTFTSTVEFSLSFIVITHRSLHVFHAAGVYVNVPFATAHVHFVPFVFTPLKLN
jgi:hypothetical protein